MLDGKDGKVKLLNVNIVVKKAMVVKYIGLTKTIYIKEN